MPQQLLHGADVVTVSQKMRGEGMPEGVAGRPLGQSGVPDSLGNCLLHDGFVDMMPPLMPCLVVCPAVLLREDPLPTPFGRGVGVLAVEGVRHLDAPPTVAQVLFMGLPGLFADGSGAAF